MTWILVTEELPDDGRDVLITYEGYVEVASYFPDDGWYDSNFHKQYPTHWMNLPTPPNKRKT